MYPIECLAIIITLLEPHMQVLHRQTDKQTEADKQTVGEGRSEVSCVPKVTYLTENWFMRVPPAFETTKSK